MSWDRSSSFSVIIYNSLCNICITVHIDFCSQTRLHPLAWDTWWHCNLIFWEKLSYWNRRTAHQQTRTKTFRLDQCTRYKCTAQSPVVAISVLLLWETFITCTKLLPSFLEENCSGYSQVILNLFVLSFGLQLHEW